MTFGEVLWAMIVFYFVIMIIWMFIAIFGDIFRRDDMSGWAKAGWIFLIVVLPFLGILIYVISRPKMTEQDLEIVAEQQAAQRRAAGYSATDEIARAAELRDKGTITDAQFEKIKSDALA
jgi:predicted membrane channel-forming protein YqfA (hemolysin III family)